MTRRPPDPRLLASPRARLGGAGQTQDQGGSTVNPTVADIRAYQEEKLRHEQKELAAAKRENPYCLVVDCPKWTKGKCAGCPHA